MVFVSCCLFVSSIKGQQTKKLEGRVFSKDGDVAGTHVMNISSQKATITDAIGFFSVQVRLNDTLVFSAIQYKRKVVPVNSEILESRFLNIFLEEERIKLDEVLVTPYNLTGDLTKDLDSLNIGSVVTTGSVGLPNADIIPLTPSERKFYAARTWDAYFYILAAGTRIDPLINYFSGRTKMLKKRIAQDNANEQMKSIRHIYVDSLFIHGMHIPRESIADFMNFCEVDSTFQSTLEINDRLVFWEFMRRKSVTYRKNNNLD